MGTIRATVSRVGRDVAFGLGEHGGSWRCTKECKRCASVFGVFDVYVRLCVIRYESGCVYLVKTGDQARYAK